MREVSRLRLSCDWWMAIVDAQTQRQAIVESREGVLVIERGQLASGSQAESASARSMHPSVAIGFDSNKKRFVLRHDGASVRDNCTDLILDEAWLERVRPRKHDALNQDSQFNEETQASNVAGNIASRYVLQMSPAPQRASNRQPEWSGAALVVGDNPVARQLEKRLRSEGVSVTRLAAHDDPHWLAEQLTELSKTELVKHLFIATPCDPDARISLDETSWLSRRNKGLMGIFWLCQRWLNQIVTANCADDSSLVAISTQGGDFGFSGNIQSAEGGGIGGLAEVDFD